MTKKLLVISGPCALENIDVCLAVARELKSSATAHVGLTPVFKGSYDKANRSSIDAGRGPGIQKGLEMLAEVRDEVGLPVTTDIHEPWQAEVAAEVVDILQIPALLSRQTDLLLAAASTGRTVNLKKGQFMAPWETDAAVEKLWRSGATDVLVTERGTTFGYGQMVVDFRSLVYLTRRGHRVVLDASHSTQWTRDDGFTRQASFIAPLARAAVVVGVDGIFFECHPRPHDAVSDGPRSLPLAELSELIDGLGSLHRFVTTDGTRSTEPPPRPERFDHPDRAGIPTVL
jgi:2-dehydro-3-deoxyphosphooctonate aldolase (KDO 8-P synthase)